MHQENPAKPGYTAEDDAVAGQAVLHKGRTWSANIDPFESAPVHLHQLLSPFVDHMGAFETQGYGCATTLASLGRAPEAADTLFVYPGDGTKGGDNAARDAAPRWPRHADPDLPPDAVRATLAGAAPEFSTKVPAPPR